MAARLAAGGIVLALAAVACASPPGAPSPFRTLVSAQIGVPTPAAPVGGALVSRTNGAISLTVRNTMALVAAPVYVTFDLSRSSTFDAQNTSTRTVAQADGDSTIVMFAVPAGATIGSTYYWRARARAGEDRGAYSATATFDVGPDTGPAPTTPGQPQLVSPAPGATENITATFVVRQPTDTSMVDGYEIQVSPSASFDRNVSPCVATAVVGDAIASCAMLLQPGAYFWRAQAVVIPKNGTSLANGLHGPFSAAMPFQVVKENLDIYQLISPAALGDGTPNPVTLTVANLARTGSVGPLAYAFSLYTGESPIRSALAATSTVPEDPSGQTSWTVPFELPVGVVYAISVHVVDTANGVTGNDLYGLLAVVAAKSVPLTLTVSSAGHNPGCGRAFQVPVFASRDLGQSRVTIANGYNLQMNLATKAFVRLDGTIQGAQIGMFSIGGTSTPEARVVGTITGHNMAAGSIDGQVWLESALDPILCSPAGGTWTLVPR